MKLLAIDPSIRSCGAAAFVGNDLTSATRIQSAFSDARYQMGSRCLAVASEVKRWYQLIPDVIVTEWPQIYTAAKSKGDPNDLIPMAGVGCALAAMFGPFHTMFYTPTPREWIGNIPKVCPKCKGRASKACKVCGGSPWRTPRGALIRDSLTASELTRIPAQHDVIDAVGIGLWKLDRLILGRVFPGAV